MKKRIGLWKAIIAMMLSAALVLPAAEGVALRAEEITLPEEEITSEAKGTVGIDDYPDNLKNAVKDSIIDPWRFWNRECTSFVAWRLNNNNGVTFTNLYGGVKWGNANNWGNAAESIGLTVDNTPAPGSVWWSSAGAYGHVAWVKEVNGSQVTIEEYNYSYDGKYNSRVVSANSASGYIHIKDIGPTGKLETNRHASATIPNGNYHIVSALGTDMALDVMDPNIITIWNNIDLSADVFTVEYFADQLGGCYKIRQKGTNRVLDITGANMNMGAGLQVLNNGGTPNDYQKWLIYGVGNELWMIQAIGNNYWLDVDHDSNTMNVANGNAVVLWEKHDGQNQKWYFVPMVTSAVMNKTAVTLEEGTGEGLNVTVNPEHKLNQAIRSWKSSDSSIAEVDANGYVYAKKAGRATITATTKYDSVEASCVVTVTEKKDSPNEDTESDTLGTELSKGIGRTIPDGNYHIVSALGDDMALDVMEPNKNVVIWNNIDQTTDAFSVKYQTNGFYRLTQFGTNNNLGVENANMYRGASLQVLPNTGSLTSSEEWLVHGIGDELWMIQSRRNNFWIDVDHSTDMSIQNGNKILLWEKNDAINQKWYLIPVVTSATMNKASLSLYEGGKETLSVSVVPDHIKNREIRQWISSDESVAAVDQLGNVTARKAGKAIITATTKYDGKAANCEVTVLAENPETEKGTEKDTEKDTEEDTENPVSADTVIAVKQKLDVTSLFTDKYLKYQVTPKSNASITSKGILTAKKAGDITVTGLVKKEGKWIPDTENEITVTAELPEFEEKSVLLSFIGATMDARDNLKAMSSEPSSWASSNAKVAVIDSKTGEITAVKAGSVRISAVFGEGKQAAKYSFTVKVVVPSISKKKASMQTGANLTLKLNKARTEPVWTSEDEEIAEVDENGVVTALNAGETKIIATLDGNDYVCVLQVKAPTLSAKKVTIKAGNTRKLKLNGTKLTEIVWLSSNEDIAEVDENGIVTAKETGTAEINTTAGGCRDVCVVTVK